MLLTIINSPPTQRASIEVIRSASTWALRGFGEALTEEQCEVLKNHTGEVASIIAKYLLRKFWDWQDQGGPLDQEQARRLVCGGGQRGQAQDALGTPDSPAITDLSPESGSASGGTVLTIRGSGFGRTSRVRFEGQAAAASFTAGSDSEIATATPALRCQGSCSPEVNVRVCAAAGACSPPRKFTYITPPTKKR